MKILFANGKPVNDDASRVCVLFDPQNGRVVHVHGVTTLDGGKKVSEAELEERTIARAKALGRSVSGLKALHLPVSALRESRIFKVDANGTGLEMSRQTPIRSSEFMARWLKGRANRGT